MWALRKELLRGLWQSAVRRLPGKGIQSGNQLTIIRAQEKAARAAADAEVEQPVSAIVGVDRVRILSERGERHCSGQCRPRLRQAQYDGTVRASKRKCAQLVVQVQTKAGLGQARLNPRLV